MLQVESLLDSYSTMLVELPEATRLRALQEQADSWATEARQLLDGCQPISESQAPAMEVCPSSCCVLFRWLCFWACWPFHRLFLLCITHI
jgi:hypothetical protein